MAANAGNMTVIEVSGLYIYIYIWSQMADLLLIDGLSSRGSTYVVVDCRYPFEYEAGHIQGAVNIYTKSDLINEFFMNPIDGIGSKHPTTRTIVVFHCEFSSKRGPSM
jgi:rhodanese-related sulfurtransferase